MVSEVARRKTLNAFASLQTPAKPSTGSHAITQIRAFTRTSSANTAPYSLVEVQTRSGILGYGECKPLSRADVQALQVLVGRSAHAYEALTSMAPEPARGGINMALLDIVGKITNAPVYRVLGGPTRFKARAIARLHGNSINDLRTEMQRHISSGIRAFLLPIDAPIAHNQGSSFVKTHVDRFSALRAAAPDADFAVEARGELTPSDAGVLAAALEPMRPLWFDEPCAVTNLTTLRKISDETVVPLGFGRDIRDPGIFQDLLREGVIDLMRPDLLLYGISGVCRIAAMAETYYTAVAPRHNAGPLAMAAALHAAASMPNFFALEVPAFGVGQTAIRDGFFELPKVPGLGVTVDNKEWEGSQIA